MEQSRTLSGRSRFTAIFGDPVEHSLSPAMHNAAYAGLAMDRAYLAFHVTPDRLRDAIRAIPALGLLGVNLTVPHKQRAARMMARLSDEARILGAINCVVNREGVLSGDNTDARGLEADLREAGLELEAKLAVIIGAGGAAAAAVLAALRLGAGRIAIGNRTRARAQALARRFARHITARGKDRARATITTCGLDTLTRPDLLAQAALVVNATSIGLQGGGFIPLDYAATSDDCLFYDLIYAREPTPFLQSAAARGRRALDGAGMLAEQGELAFELFNGTPPPPGAMRTALLAALGRA
ncbi:MAG TPA: shikimate dehydrogenase [Candidatus Binataceae bacterium]|nr:shikimate dehydrogenase [Candidatus Binataceae bacterium]